MPGLLRTRWPAGMGLIPWRSVAMGSFGIVKGAAAVSILRARVLLTCGIKHVGNTPTASYPQWRTALGHHIAEGGASIDQSKKSARRFPWQMPRSLFRIHPRHQRKTRKVVAKTYRTASRPRRRQTGRWQDSRCGRKPTRRCNEAAETSAPHGGSRPRHSGTQLHRR